MKDTIYIDVEDDITAIIGKVKAAKNKVVALVPPKRTGVLQSAVNLRLLARAAKQTDKRLVLISGNSALTALAASAGIPSARTLQSKPEMPSIPESDDDDVEDVINGAELPIGDLARTDDAHAETVAASAAVSSAILANAAEETPEQMPSLVRKPTGTPMRSKVKIPNFDTFRKKLALIIGGGVVLLAFLVWAIWFAPHAKIIITARTIESSANPKVTLASTLATDAKAGTIKAIAQQIKKDAAFPFDATGRKEVGDKAKGQVVFENCETDEAQAVPAGTGISAGGMTYITQTAVTVPKAKISGGCNPGKSDPVAIVAQDIGDEYNANTGTRFSVAGHANTSAIFYFRAVASSDITGGNRKKITIVTKDDIQKATDQFTAQNTDEAKKQLTAQFGDGVSVIDLSFYIDQSAIASSPAVDQEATDGKAKLTGSLTFTMLGVDKREAGTFLDAYFAKQIEGKNNQRVYSNGVDKISFFDVQRTEGGAYAATMAVTAKLGPKIDDSEVKKGAIGKRYGEVQSSLERISGVENVDVKFSPFWVSSVPKDEKRISIEFKLDESK